MRAKAKAKQHKKLTISHATVCRHPGSLCVSCEGSTLTYEQANDLASHLAAHLAAAGAGPDVPVGILLERCCELPVVFLAVLKAGSALMPLDPGYPVQRLAGYLEDLQPAMLITQTKLAGRAAALAGASIKVLVLEELLVATAPSAEAVASATASLPARHLSDMAYIIFTSGSTGRPKAVAVEQHSLAEYCLSTIDISGLSSSTISLTVSSISFDAHVITIYPVLAAGGKVVLPRQEDHLNPQYLGDLITSQSVSYTFLVPAVASMLVQEPSFGQQHGSMKAVYFGGEPVSTAVLESLHKAFPGARIFVMYGPTEATCTVAYLETTRCGSAANTLGAPEPNVQLYIVDEQLQLVPPGWPGELLVSGPRLARGYIGRPELTAEKFISNPFFSDLLERSAHTSSCLPGASYLRRYYQRAYRTGDLARLRGDGSLEYLGRSDRQVSTGPAGLCHWREEQRTIQKNRVLFQSSVGYGETVGYFSPAWGS